MKREIGTELLDVFQLPITDFHVHSVYSGGNLPLEKIGYFSKKEKLSVGIADQYSWHRYKQSRVTRQIDQYLNSITGAKAKHGCIYRGIEIDTTSVHRFTLFEQFTDRLDFVLFEFVLDLAGNYSYDPKRRNRTMDHLVEIARFKKETGLLVGLSRPDVSLVIDQSLLKTSLDFIERTGIAIELNEKYGNYYTPLFVKEVLSRNIPLFCGTSARELADIGKFPFISQFIAQNSGNLPIEKKMVSTL